MKHVEKLQLKKALEEWLDNSVQLDGTGLPIPTETLFYAATKGLDLSPNRETDATTLAQMTFALVLKLLEEDTQLRREISELRTQLLEQKHGN